MGKPEVTKRNIIMSTIQLAQKVGPDNVTVREVCEGAGISKNTFYLYFHNIGEVFGETYFTDDEEKRTRLPHIMMEFDSPLEQFWELLKIDINRHIQFGPKIIGIISMKNVSAIPFFSDDPEEQPESVRIFISLVEKMQRMGEIKNMSNAALIVKSVYIQAVGLDIRWSQMEGDFDFKRESYDMLVTLLQPNIEITNY